MSIISTVTSSSTSIISTVTSSSTGSDQTTSILSTTSTEAKGTGTISSTEESVIPSISTPSTTDNSTISSTEESVIPSISTPSTTDNSTISSTEESVIPSISTTDNSTGETNSSVYAGIGAGLAVIVIIILILIIVGCLIWRKPWKGEKDSSEPIAFVTMSRYSNPENSQASPIYEEAMASEDITRDAAPTSMRHPPSQLEMPTYMYQDPCIIQRTQAPNLGYLYAEVDKKKEPQKQVVYAQVDKERKKRGDGIVYADLDPASTQGGIFTENIAVNVIYSDINN
ncbi:PREDICTED: cell wall integrity and stress response component 2-like isoform X1 [Amphimedon queenslandica]|uniref:Uncharacterized protein n=1 Tax=Amphimedon queenslandica TaxID=400682 RepID=A0AAN0JIE9_AMPQE|nr:PREDICTED: cell wall integrity and stress response component 2-like isoform X1 [Amphimedon queenslandica]|eukprot:XP_019856790.1 PREDICTED: cell wall integrity and stress response component 2-like isoform X1 [Amphimedon queenslandica]